MDTLKQVFRFTAEKICNNIGNRTKFVSAM